MKKIFSFIALILVASMSFAQKAEPSQDVSHGLKIKMDQTFNQAYRNGQWESGDPIDAESVITINNAEGWIYFNTAESFYKINNFGFGKWNCYDENGNNLTVSITREENGDSYVSVIYDKRVAWVGRITVEKAIMKPIRRPFMPMFRRAPAVPDFSRWPRPANAMGTPMMPQAQNEGFRMTPYQTNIR